MAELFENTADPQTAPTQVVDSTKDYFDELVGEGKKYKDNFTAGQAIAHKDAHIERLELENARIRQDVADDGKLDNIAAQLLALQPNGTPTETPGLETPGEAPEGSEQPASQFTPEQVEELVSKKIQDSLSAQSLDQKLAVAKQKLSEKYGAGYESVLQKGMVEHGLSKEVITEMALQNPDSVIKLLGDPAPVQGIVEGINTTGLNVSPSGVRNEAYFNKIKLADPKNYMSKEVQIELHNEALKQGASFFE